MISDAVFDFGKCRSDLIYFDPERFQRKLHAFWAGERLGIALVEL
tara:strand:- start:498 stop:632 length:135 start_codon:yes stop_codon:yes gene_type:complete